MFAAALLAVSTFVMWVFQSTATTARGALGELYATRAYYGAESGMEFALRELRLGSDLDGDGVAGSISSDSNDANDPTVGQATFHVSYASKILTCRGAADVYIRIVEATLQ